MTNFDLYYQALAADIAWSELLQAKFGKRAGDARYTDEGQSTPELDDAKAEFIRASTVWIDEMQRNR